MAARGAFGLLKHGRLALRPLRRGIRIVQHLACYRVPGERRRCPACASPAIDHLEPLVSGRSSFRFGFISGCRRCGLLFANPLPDDSDLETVYSPGGEWGRHRQEEQEKQVSAGRLDALFAPIRGELRVLQPPADASVLDFGCGLGGMLDAFAAAGWRTYGIDPATKLAFSRHRELTVPPAEAVFDLAILHHVLEHVTAPLSILRDLAAAVRPGGFLLVSVPNIDDLPEHGDVKYCLRSEVHVLAYTSDCLAWLLAVAGFRVVSDARAPGNPRKRVVLGRRENVPLSGPPTPLRSGRAVLARYSATHAASSHARPRWLPVRVRAAYADLKRAEWRIQR
jgi:SAM-dependent methyltransferase